MEVKKKGSEDRDEDREEWEKASGTGKEDEEHGIRESGENDEVRNERKERESTKTKDEERSTGEASGETSNKHGGEPRRFLAAVEKMR